MLPGSLTPRLQEHLAHLGSWMPFERAAQMLSTLLGAQVSEPTVRRGTERAGAHMQARETAHRQQPSASASQESGCEKLVVSADGAYVPLTEGEWAEVRTLAIGEVKPISPVSAEVQTQHLSSFSRMTDAETFAIVAEGEMGRRGVSQAQAVCAVTDGAPWIQGFLDLHCQDAVRILDFPHAAEHLHLLLQALEQAQVPLPEQALPRSLHVLKHRGPALLLQWCERLPEEIKTLEAVQKQLDYFGKRVDLMQSPTFEQQGWPIGSGMVESANKVVVQARLKGAGMHWSRKHVNPMLALRTAVCNERWDEAWPEGLREPQQQRAITHQQQADARLQESLSCLLLLLLRFRPSPHPKPVPAPLPRVEEPAATLPGSSCPSPSHPWKRGPSCRPRSIATL